MRLDGLAWGEGYEALKHQSFVGAGYFDEITTLVTGGLSSTLAMSGSTEAAQFTEVVPPVHPVHPAPQRHGGKSAKERAAAS